jgi:hypothetical protein
MMIAKVRRLRHELSMIPAGLLYGLAEGHLNLSTAVLSRDPRGRVERRLVTAALADDSLADRISAALLVCPACGQLDAGHDCPGPASDEPHYNDMPDYPDLLDSF